MFDENNLRTFLSYGGGVQTFALLLLILQGKLSKPNFLIFSDTGCEWPNTYKHIEEVAKPICKLLGIPFITVMYKDGLISGYMDTNSIPMAGFRSCTYNYKVRPIHNYLKEEFFDEKVNGRPSFVSLIGISTDERNRAIPVKDQSPMWVRLEYPLLDLDLSRRQCLDIIEQSDYPSVLKSGCYLCPYSKLTEWARLKKTQPELMNVAIELEENYRSHRPERLAGLMGVDRQMWLKDFNQLSSLFDFTDYDEPITSCDSKQNGGCFL